MVQIGMRSFQTENIGVFIVAEKASNGLLSLLRKGIPAHGEYPVSAVV